MLSDSDITLLKDVIYAYLNLFETYNSDDARHLHAILKKLELAQTEGSR